MENTKHTLWTKVSIWFAALEFTSVDYYELRSQQVMAELLTLRDRVDRLEVEATNQLANPTRKEES